MKAKMEKLEGPLQRLLDWARNEEDVRAILLIGSRADPTALIDGLSDYDVVLFVEPDSNLAKKHEWVETFGSILVMLRERVEHLDQAVPTLLVQYAEGHRIDFTLSPVEILRRLGQDRDLPEWLDLGYRVLLDKDGLTSGLRAASGDAYIPARPLESEFRGVVNEFWWESIYVAKYLARGELLPARYSMDCVLRFDCLVRMLEWYVQVGRKWKQRVGSRGRWLAQLLDAEDRELLEATFAGSDLDANWQALDAALRLFRKAAMSVADDLNYTLPAALGRDVEEFLQEIRESARPA